MKLKVRIFDYTCKSVIPSTGDDGLYEETASDMAKLILARSNPYHEHSTTDIEVNHYAQLHADTWIEETALHIELYSSASQDSREMHVPSGRENDKTVLKTKSFSGNVSGVIGETLFALVMYHIYKVDEENIAHLRAHSSIGIFPDFAIYRPTPQLEDKIKEMLPATRIEYPIPCEVKTVTRANLSLSPIKSGVLKAISQIQSYWTKQPINGVSIIAVAVRNYDEQCYDLSLVWSY